MCLRNKGKTADPSQGCAWRSYLHNGKHRLGGALYLYSDEDELCAAIKIKVAYFVAVASGVLTCKAKLIHKAKRIAALESEIESDGRLVAKATGTYSIFGGKGD